MSAQTTLPAIPPNDYEGTIAAWELALISRGKLKPGQFYGDIRLTHEEYGEILEECES